MKSPFVLILLLLTTIVAAWQFVNKAGSEHDDIDKAEITLQELKELLPKGSRITLAPPNTPIDIQLRINYVLAPVLVSSTVNYDTVLSVTPGNTDSMPANRKIIWQQADGQYHYYLSCSSK